MYLQLYQVYIDIMDAIPSKDVKKVLQTQLENRGVSSKSNKEREVFARRME